MNTPTRLGVFSLGLTVAFGVAFGAGQLTGPVRAHTGTSTETKPEAHPEALPEARPEAHAGTSGVTAGLPAGLQVSDRGYTLTRVSGDDGEFAFRITGPDGRAVTAFDAAHDKRMHLIVVRRDLSGFRHVHPRMDTDGTWRVAAPMSGPGTYRAFADFKPTGSDPLTLGIDAIVPGAATPAPLPGPARTASVDGYTVTLGGSLEAGRTGELTFTVSRGGRPVTDLQPYLAAYGHLVALRVGDLAYLHVHPTGTPGDGTTEPGPDIAFQAEVPTTGDYRLYLDFQHDGTVHTAEFTAVAGVPGHWATATPTRRADGHQQHDH